MKRCPTCNRTYEDDALSFCLTDGSVLVTGEPIAGSFDQPPMAAPPTAPDWSTPPKPAVPSTPSWSSVGLPPQAPSPTWGTGYPQAPPMGGYAIQKKEQGLAIGSLVCGIASYVLCCNIFTGIPAIVLGLMALNKEKTDPARYTGKGMAIGGIVLGSVSILIFLLYIILTLARSIDLS